jgi:hypothetical protein
MHFYGGGLRWVDMPDLTVGELAVLEGFRDAVIEARRGR